MPSNIELEKQVSDLRAELTTLKEVLDRTFRAAGLSTEWSQSKYQIRIVENASQNVESKT